MITGVKPGDTGSWVKQDRIVSLHFGGYFITCSPYAMAGVKRSHDGTRIDKMEKSSESPYIPVFEELRAELDEHHDRRERVIKASRDVTAQSKKM